MNIDYVRRAFKEEIGWGMIFINYPDLFYVEDDKFLEFLYWKYDELQKIK